jgi:hypothetical protein
MARACHRDSHAGGGILDYSIKGSIAPSISPGFYVGLAEEVRSSTYACGSLGKRNTVNMLHSKLFCDVSAFN